MIEYIKYVLGKGLIKPKLSDIEIKTSDSEPLVLITAWHKKHRIGEMKCVIYREEKRILIGDIVVEKYENMGIGTKMIETLFRCAKENAFSRITGELSTVDDRNKLLYFYNKLGFDIQFHELRRDNTYASISKMMEL
jgi:GNAT superfamily N-acetyltransferase